MITRVIAVALAVIAMMWAGPAAAAASADDSYVSPARVSVTPAVIEPGGRSTIEFSAGFFEGGEGVTTDVSGARSGEARVLGAAGTATLVSRADGGLTAVFHASERGCGPYAITFSASRDYVAIVTVTSGNGPRDEAGALAPPGPDLGVAAPGTAVPDTGTAREPLGLPDEWTGSRDREGRVQIPGTRPDAPEWPGLEDLPWTIVLLAGIALVATTVAGTLLIAARRRG
ncbi:hypothetical protein [Microbacterium sp.]|jgi:hypothetical protein|uniref:hypothetical protein n=1 Tax=Microbacterium sp. TaxID=51671 RepID=UPI0037C6AD13